ncbi:MAG: hypothetical protein RLZ62_2330 [Bacteroidota bacterium]
MRQILIPVLLVLSASYVCVAQGGIAPSREVGVIYNRERTFNMRLATNRNMSVGMEFGNLRTYYKTKTWYAGIGEIRHPKEQRQNSDPRVSRAFRPFVYGKMNSLMVLRAGWGAKRYYSEKARQRGVAVGMSYNIGPTLGILKPYYLALAYQGENSTTFRILHQRYTEGNSSVFLDNTRILGASAFARGLKEISFMPGINASVAYHMDWGAFDEMVKALEIGVAVDLFGQKVPVFVSNEVNSRLFINFFVNLQLGKRR